MLNAAMPCRRAVKSLDLAVRVNGQRMSRHSKAKRDARRKQRPKAAANRVLPPVQTHAQLVEGGAVIGGAGQQGDDWILFLAGKAVATTDSAAMLLAMLKHTAAQCHAGGRDVVLSVSTGLRDAATLEAEAEGKSLDEYLAMLENERVERKQKADGTP
jgi:hypothetical protein